MSTMQMACSLNRANKTTKQTSNSVCWGVVLMQPGTVPKKLSVPGTSRHHPLNKCDYFSIHHIPLTSLEMMEGGGEIKSQLRDHLNPFWIRLTVEPTIYTNHHSIKHRSNFWPYGAGLPCEVAKHFKGNAHLSNESIELDGFTRFTIGDFVVSLLFHRRLSALSHPNSHQYREHRTNGLNPIWSMLTFPRQANNRVNQDNDNRREEQRLAHISKCETNVEFLLQHANLPASLIAESMPASCHHVQQVAA